MSFQRERVALYYVDLLTLNRNDLADLAGMSRESTSRILSLFKEQEIIKVTGRKFEILDKKQLEHIARYG